MKNGQQREESASVPITLMMIGMAKVTPVERERIDWMRASAASRRWRTVLCVSLTMV